MPGDAPSREGRPHGHEAVGCCSRRGLHRPLAVRPDAVRRDQRLDLGCQRRGHAGRDRHLAQPGDQCRARGPDQRGGPLHAAGDSARHLHPQGGAHRFPDHRAEGHPGPGRERHPHRRDDGGGRAVRGRGHQGRRAAAADRELRGRHGHREPRDRRTAAQRPQLSAARPRSSRVRRPTVPRRARASSGWAGSATALR